ncbi:MAG: rhamnulokinase family protein [Planctomycetota bacterium]
MADKLYLAVDLGASGGRVVGGRFDGTRLTLDEVHRFENGGIAAADRLYWDLLSLWTRIQEGLRAAASRFGEQIVSVGVDTWGVDFGLLGRGDELLGNPYTYRDRRTNGIFDRAFADISRAEVFAETGVQFMEFNTLFQLLAMKYAQSPLLEVAESFLMMPDLLHWLLSGEKANEYSNASTTQFLNPKTRAWSKKLFERLELPERILGELVQPGTSLGPLRASVAAATGLRNVQVVLPGTHDTASAVMAVPASSRPGERPDWCYISSGTWSLMGVEVPEPIVNDRCRELNFTNEGGVGGTTRLLKNIAGLWLVQECRRLWKLEGHEYGWSHLVELAERSPALLSLINPDHGDFVAPTNMIKTIREFCARTKQPTPDSVGAVIRCALESLALRYRMVLGWLEQLVGGHISTIHIVGGGTQNKLLCQMTADACNRRVVAGPIEATASGNVMLQAVASGDVGSIAQARDVIRHSFAVEEYYPQQPLPWDYAYERFVKLF